MKNGISFTIWLIVLTGIQFVINCSNPLEDIDNGNLTPPGPITDVDTIIVVDTLPVIDTLIIVEPGSGESKMVCSRITSNIQEIVWLFRNSEGLYCLEFAAALESEHPTQTITIDIGGQELLWRPSDSSELVKDLYLDQNVIIRITPKKPPSLGHALDICLTFSKL